MVFVRNYKKNKGLKDGQIQINFLTLYLHLGLMVEYSNLTKESCLKTTRLNLEAFKTNQLSLRAFESMVYY